MTAALPELPDLPRLVTARAGPAGAGPSRARRARRALPRLILRAATCPATWLCVAAAIFYSALAVDRVDQHIAGSYDYGIIFQVIHGWAFHGYPSEPLGMPQFSTEWGDHFAPMLALLAPLLWIHDSPSMIGIAQACLISAAGVPVYLAVRRLQGPTVATIACVLFLSCVEVQDAVGFDIHENMFEPLLIGIAIERALARKWTAASIVIGLTLLCYEDMGSLVFLFGLWAAANRKWRHAAVLCVAGPAMMFLFTGFIVPTFGHDLPYWELRHFDYEKSLHASTMMQAAAHAIEHPHHLLRLLVNRRAKRDTWWLLLAPVGFLCLASPIGYLGSTSVVLLMVSDNDTHWSTHYHFYLQVAPIIIIGAADGLRRIGLLIRWTWRRVASSSPEGLGLARHRGLLDRVWALRLWRLGVVALAMIGLCSSLVMEREPSRALFMYAWQYERGKLNRPAALNAAIDRAADRVPAGRKVYVSNDLGTAVVAKDTDVAEPAYAQYVLFDTGTPWIPANFEQLLEAQGFHVTYETGGDVFVMER